MTINEVNRFKEILDIYEQVYLIIFGNPNKSITFATATQKRSSLCEPANWLKHSSELSPAKRFIPVRYKI